MKIETHQSDCLDILPTLPEESVDLVYLDPPFFTQRKQRLRSRDRSQEFSFDDRWDSMPQYATFLIKRLYEIRRILKSSGSIIFHCDKTASHIARFILDTIFGEDYFQSEIIWNYRRWSNSARKLLPAHQTLLFYTKSDTYKFNTIFTDYSPTTNVDQILQRRTRDTTNKSVYARNENGEIIYHGAKKGVPLSDVWEIPYLNPKAKERTGYPTQKPILLLERIICLTTDENDLIVDPFCGSGTTLIAAKLLNRSAIGIDISEDAIQLTQKRLREPIKTESNRMKHGMISYQNADQNALSRLQNIPHTPVHRNNGIDAFLHETFNDVPIPVRVQKRGETLSEAINALQKAAKSKNAKRMILIATEDTPDLFQPTIPDSMIVVNSAELAIRRALKNKT